MARDGTLARRLLMLLSDNRLHTTVELAGRLQISEELVIAMADNLVRHGYLMPIDGGCATRCAECSLTRICAGSDVISPAGRLLALAPKGRRAVQTRAAFPEQDET